MLIEKSIAPPLPSLRPTKPTSSATFPVYHDLEASLTEEEQQPDQQPPVQSGEEASPRAARHIYPSGHFVETVSHSAQANYPFRSPAPRSCRCPPALP